MSTYAVERERFAVQPDDPRIMPEPNSGCWLWIGRISTKGYGAVIRRRQGNTTTRVAHRAVYETMRGPVPVGLTLDHLCRVPSCVNPQHLEPVSMRENILRGVSPSALNARRDRCQYGHPLVQGTTQRKCLICCAAATRRWKARQS